MKRFEVVCRKAGCANEGEFIKILNPDEQPVVICGVCNSTITEIVFIEEVAESGE